MPDKDQNRVAPESEPDYDSLSMEDLDRLIAGGELPKDEPPSEAAPESVEVTPEPEPEPSPDAAAEPEPEPEKEPDPRELMIQELEARVKHFESLAGRNAGELGFVKQQLRKLQEAQSAPRADEDTFDVEPPPERRPAPRREPVGRDDVAAWAVSQAVTQAVAEFGRQHPDLAEMQEAIGAYLTQSGYDPKAVLESDSPVEAAKETTRVLDSAYWHAKAEATAKKRQELMSKRASQFPQAEKAKRKAAISGTGNAPPPKPQPKTFDDMSLEELEAEIQKQLRE